MEDERIDLSALDPARDEKRWSEMIDRVSARSIAARSRPRADAGAGLIAHQIVAWARPALAIAATLALVVWAVAFAANSSRSPAVGEAARAEPAFALSTWASRDELPSTADLLDTLGGEHAEP